MKLVARSYPRCISLLLVGTMLVLSAPMAQAKSLTPIEVHARIVKRGIGNWACVQLLNGTAFVGRIVDIRDDGFGMQLHNDPEITDVRYSDVIGLRTGISNGAFWGIMAAGVGGVVAMTAIGIHEVHANEQMPTLPSEPTQPVFP